MPPLETVTPVGIEAVAVVAAILTAIAAATVMGAPEDSADGVVPEPDESAPPLSVAWVFAASRSSAICEFTLPVAAPSSGAPG